MADRPTRNTIAMAGPLFALLLAAAVAAPTIASAHTREDEAACRPDVLRLCMWAIPSGERRIVACLIHNKRYLNDACYRVFDREPASRAAGHPEAQPVQWSR